MLEVENILLCCSQKSGLDKDDYEDAFTPLSSVDKHNKKIKIAVADGATESSFSKEWANILVEKYSSSNFEITDNKFFEEAFKDWESYINQKKLSWFATEKLNNGAFAAFLGLNIDLESNTYKVEAIGDCCLFLIRNNQIATTFPLTNFEDFTNNPTLLSTRDINSLSNFKNISGELLPGDMLIMASDALSAFILKEKSSLPWEFFVQLCSKSSKKREKDKLLNNWKNLKKEWTNIDHDNEIDKFTNLVFQKQTENNEQEDWIFKNWIFKNWLEQQRNNGSIKNDDVTLYLIKMKD